MNKHKSPLAIQRPAKRKRRRRIKPWGICLHTSGRGIVKRAKRRDVQVIDLALEWYRAREQSGVHYVIDYDGTIYQMLNDNHRGAHIGISAKERRAYLSGRWIREVSTQAGILWRKRWPNHVSPQHLYPTRSPNGCYVGVEMLPLAAEDVGDDGLWFTSEQHRSAQALACDLAIRHRWPLNWEHSSRLIGHEDVDAYARWDRRGGWDPGAMRQQPRFVNHR